MDDPKRYVRLVLLTLGIAALLFIFLFIVFRVTGLTLPTGLQIILCLLGAGYIVYRYFARRLF